ncbi:hypothetical protein HG536_0A08220 [Torulaspora globosa]|uniref:Uncharacterized protein n=1 Tax=Torulaspora globosa TaxID=48254 RepID=A0A7G3ZBX1_9SACH|nr:uncharacterized protein HG536_0A08220 [Torulaspora globosa]QLL31007.1 hypothetical protein HG536_0A08220 [Torulaspora globosa]
MASSLPTIIFACLAVLMSFLRRYKPFRNWAASLMQHSLSDYLLPSKQLVVATPDFKICKTAPCFETSESTTLYELTQCLAQLQEYSVRAQRQNATIFNRTKELDEIHIEQLRELEYFSKIKEVNKCIEANHSVLKAVISHILEKIVRANFKNTEDEALPDQLKTICAELGYTLNNDGSLKFVSEQVVLAASPSNQNRVNEAIGHLCRDWSSGFLCEREPLIEFICKSLNHPSVDSGKRTLIVIPGAGAGQIPYSTAKKFPNFDVVSIELSPLMYVFNEFALDHGTDVGIRPFCQHYSGSSSVQSQTRKFNVQLTGIKRPSNLTVHWGNFLQYTTNGQKYDQVIVCTAFFIDTAENLFEYIKAIESLSDCCDELQWINIGPLKYETRPLVQFTADELRQLRELRGWRDIVEERVTDYKSGLNGYMTDRESLYQGYYGLLKFHTRFQKEKNTIRDD